MTQSEILKKAVQESGMKIEHLCDKVGVRSQTYRNFIQSGKGLATHHLEKFAEVLGYDINWNKK
ncbi:MAG: helix-turn-helix transcriptional regulator [Saprospiraceae bacterium]|nr:helix-turn-helix transcriptional regulator [Saprospiraceae bacterium]